MRLQDLLPNLPETLPDQRVPGAAVYLRQRDHPRAGHQLVHRTGLRQLRPELHQPHPLRLWIHLACE